MHETIKTPESSKGSKSCSHTIPLDEVVRKQAGTMYLLQDESFRFQPSVPSGETLYNSTLVENKNGAVKVSDKSVVMRIAVKADCADIPSELVMRAAELVAPLSDKNRQALQIPAELVHRIGQTPHTQVFVREGKAVLLTEIGFDEPNPKVADIVKNATPEQLKYIKQWMDPETIFQQEVAEVCSLLGMARATREVTNKVLNQKTARTCNKTANSKE